MGEREFPLVHHEWASWVGGGGGWGFQQTDAEEKALVLGRAAEHACAWTDTLVFYAF
jgi:hypothetical protein